MYRPILVAAAALNVLGGAGMLAIAVAAYRRRSQPGMVSFGLVAGLFGGLGLALAGLFTAAEVGVDPQVFDVGFAGVTALVLSASVPWLVFVLQYTGRSGVLTRRRVAALGAPAVLYVAVVVGMAARTPAGTNDWGADGMGAVDLALFNATLLLWLFLIGLLVVGALHLLRDTRAYSHMSWRMGALLAAPSSGIGLLVAFLWQVAFAAGIEVSGLTIGTALVAGAGCYAVVVRRDDAFGSTSAAAAPVGQQVALEELSSCVFTLDDEHRIVDVNEAAQETFGLDATGPLGEPVEDVIGACVDDLTTDAPVGVDPAGDLWTASTVFLETVGGRRRFHVDAVDMTDDDGRRLGLVVGLEDITDRALREQRISILNRVLRHNLRNKLSIIRGHAEMLPDDGEADAFSGAIEEAASELLALGERARDVERLLSVDAETTADVGAVAEEVVEAHRTAAGETTFQLDVVERVHVSTPREALAFVLEELCENAAKHNDASDPRVTVRCDREGGWGRVQVIDNGPTLDDQELVAIDAEGESPLEHGSGLGLWSVRWIVTAFGGHLDVEDNEPRGSTMTVLLPVDANGQAAAASDDAAPADDLDATTAGD